VTAPLYGPDLQRLTEELADATVELPSAITGDEVHDAKLMRSVNAAGRLLVALYEARLAVGPEATR
jgi:hypothetical protein